MRVRASMCVIVCLICVHGLVSVFVCWGLFLRVLSCMSACVSERMSERDHYVRRLVCVISVIVYLYVHAVSSLIAA